MTDDRSAYLGALGRSGRLTGRQEVAVTPTVSTTAASLPAAVIKKVRRSPDFRHIPHYIWLNPRLTAAVLLLPYHHHLIIRPFQLPSIMAQMSRGNCPSLRSISSYILLTLFLTVFLFLGLLNQSTYFGKKHPKYGTYKVPPVSQIFVFLTRPQISLTLIEYLPIQACFQSAMLISVRIRLTMRSSRDYSLSPLDDTSSRMIVIGDVHGMNESLQ